MPVRAVVFDAFGTLFDVYSIGQLAEAFYPGLGNSIANLWRDKQIEYTRIVTMSDPHRPGGSRHYLPFDEITRRSLQHTLARLGIRDSSATEQALMSQYLMLPPFPEAVDVVRSLRARGVQTAILSNGNSAMLTPLLAHSNMSDLFDPVISIDAIGLYKTAPESYGLVDSQMDHPAREILFVSSNAWDALAATWHGFTTLWVNRQGMPFETLGEPPTYSGASLTRVLEVI